MSAESTEEVTTAVTEDQDDSQEETQSKTASRLEEEGDIAADYLEELLDIADIDGDIDIEVRNGRTYISIGADEESAALDSLVGRDGEVLEALQELARLGAVRYREPVPLGAGHQRIPQGARRRSPADRRGCRGQGQGRWWDCGPGTHERLRTQDRPRRRR